jgi:predicted ATPase
MKISRLKASNFKSFDAVDVELGDFNVFIGPNASGKSNLLSLLTFLRNLEREGLEDAVSMEAGEIELLRNIRIGEQRCTTVGFTVEFSDDVALNTVRPIQLRYEVSFEDMPPRIRREKAVTQLRCKDGSTPSHVAERDTEKHQLHFSTEPKEAAESSCLSSFNRQEANYGIEEAATFLPNLSLRLPNYIPPLNLGTSVQVFDLEPVHPTRISSATGRSNLESDSENLALMLRRLLRQPEKRRRFLNLTGFLLPFISDVEVDFLTQESLLLKMQESYNEDTYLPSSLLSDGTMKVVALVVALFFDDRPVAAFEEPASGLHPKLVSRLVQMMKEASEEKQILMTTHNPEVIKHVDLDDVYLVSRDDDGFSQITKPADKKEVEIFLENDLGVGDLFVQNLL